MGLQKSIGFTLLITTLTHNSEILFSDIVY